MSGIHSEMECGLELNSTFNKVFLLRLLSKSNVALKFDVIFFPACFIGLLKKKKEEASFKHVVAARRFLDKERVLWLHLLTCNVLNSAFCGSLPDVAMHHRSFKCWFALRLRGWITDPTTMSIIIGRKGGKQTCRNSRKDSKSY